MSYISSLNITYEDIITGKRRLFPYSVECHISHECVAGTKLARMGLRKGKDYRREEKTLSLFDRNELFHTYWFKSNSDAIIFRLWLPNQPNWNDNAVKNKITKASKKYMTTIITDLNK